MLSLFGFLPISTPTHAGAVWWGVILALCLTAITLLPSLLSRIWPQRRTFIENVCGKCGYNLQGLPGDICPECGADTRIVGKRRQRRFIARNIWIACAVWVVLLFWLDMNYGDYLSSYLLRGGWGIEEYSAGSGAAYSARYPNTPYVFSSLLGYAEGWHRAILFATLAIGLASILLFARLMRKRSDAAKRADGAF